MRTVRMKYGISGGRGDGSDWPLAGGLIDVSDEEAASLVGARMAEYEDDDTGPDDGGFLPSAEPVRSTVPKPIVNSPKAAWVEHAVAQGADRAEAEAMKKTELIAAYGSSA